VLTGRNSPCGALSNPPHEPFVSERVRRDLIENVFGVAVLALVGGDGGPWLILPRAAQHVAAMLIVPLAEEPAWRGYALPRLQARFGALRASLVLGVGWAAWHALMFVLQGMTPEIFVVAVVNIVAGSFVFSWLYNRTSGSVLVAVLAHAGAHVDNPARALPGDPTPFIGFTAALCVAAVALVLCDRKAWPGPGLAEAR
jgi:membrane protease YdiL (CAAX protease family)